MFIVVHLFLCRYRFYLIRSLRNVLGLSVPFVQKSNGVIAVGSLMFRATHNNHGADCW